MSRADDRIFIRNFIVVIGGLVVLTIALMIIASLLYTGDADVQEQLARQRSERYLEPVGAIRLSGEPMPKVASAEQAGSGEPRSGEQVVQQVCSACHQGNFQNAPPIGNKEQWKPRIEAGLSTLVGHVHNGYGNMPAQGSAASDKEIRSAILYMVEEKTGLEVPKGQ